MAEQTTTTPKRIICCSDGTWNKPGITDRGKVVYSNVQLMYRAIPDSGNGMRQVKMYETGVGSGYTDKDKIEGGVTGAGLDRKIRDIYSFIVMNYKLHDHIYLFGFSRGAYTARSVAGMIRNCGILRPENIHLVDKAFEYYRDRNDYTVPDSDLMRSFRSNYCVEDKTSIKFVGVWDTVGSLGLPIGNGKKNLEKYKFHDVTLSSIIENAYHALAINEHRKAFEPSLWELSEAVKNKEKKQNMEQRWFVGAHCNVGGGYEDTGLSDLALRWLMKKATEVDGNKGVAFDETMLKDSKPPIKIDPNYKGEIRDSFTLMYRLGMMKWIWRDILKKEHTNQVVDDSVFDRIDNDPKYKPKNMEGITRGTQQ